MRGNVPAADMCMRTAGGGCPVQPRSGCAGRVGKAGRARPIGDQAVIFRHISMQAAQAFAHSWQCQWS